MNKITLFFVFIGMFTLNSCTVNDQNDDVDNDTIAEVFEVTTSFGSNNGYKRNVTFNPPIYSTDMVLVYHLYEVDNGVDVWRLMPQTYYFDNGVELDYNYDFTQYDVNLFLGSNVFLDFFSSVWTQNQTFRLVVIPAMFTNRMSVDFKDYDKTIDLLGYKNTKIIKLE